MSHGQELSPRLDDDLGMRLGIGEIRKCLRHAVDADLRGDQRSGIDLAVRDRRSERANSSGV
jgi:hypothetical protein